MTVAPATHLGGSGQNIVLLHGFGADAQSWLGLAPALFEYGSVWSWETPGHGASWSITPAASLQGISEQLLPVLSELSDNPVHLIGHSLGGALALLCAAAQPALIASLSLLAPVGLGAGTNEDFLQRMPRLTQTDDVLELLRTTVHNPRFISPQVAPLVLTHLARAGVRHKLQVCAQAIQTPDPRLYAAITALHGADLPRQLIWGQDDQINPVQPQDQQRFAGNWHVLENCGHLPHIEQRTTVNRLLTQFIATTNGER